MATFVLVHGGAHGGWCFGRVSRQLREGGHTVYSPSLSGLADRKHLLSNSTDLETHIADIAQLIEYEDLSDVVLVGHSYGGMVITGVADRLPNRLLSVVYLDAAHPRDGEAMLDNITPGLRDLLRSELREVDGVELVVFPDSPLLAVMGVTDEADLEWMRAKITPHPWRSFTQNLRLQGDSAAHALHRASINCSATLKALSAEAHARRVSGSDLVIEVDAGHDVMITEPLIVAQRLVECLDHAEAHRAHRGRQPSTAC